jgi:hypothetical protein
MNIHTDERARSRRDISARIEPGGSLRIDQVDSGPLAEEMLGDFDYERILTIEEPVKLIPLLLREGFAGRALKFDDISALAREAGCKKSFWAG